MAGLCEKISMMTGHVVHLRVLYNNNLSLIGNFICVEVVQLQQKKLALDKRSQQYSYIYYYIIIGLPLGIDC